MSKITLTLSNPWQTHVRGKKSIEKFLFGCSFQANTEKPFPISPWHTKFAGCQHSFLQYKQLLEQSCFRKGDPSMQMSLQNRPWWPCNGRLSVGHVLHLCFICASSVLHLCFICASCIFMSQYVAKCRLSVECPGSLCHSIAGGSLPCLRGPHLAMGSKRWIPGISDAQNAQFQKRFEDPETENELKHCIKYTSRTAQGGGGSFKNRKPIGEVRGCESGMAERSHCWTDRRLISLSLFLWPSSYLPTYLPTDLPTYPRTYLPIHGATYPPKYLFIYPSIHLSICLCSHLLIYLSIYESIHLSIYLSIYPSICLSLSPTIYLFIYLSFCLSICLSIYLSICLSNYLSTYLSIYLTIYLSIYVSMYLSIYLSIYRSIYLSISLSIYPSSCLVIHLSIHRPSASSV